MDDNTQPEAGRSAEEVAWDEEFSSPGKTAGDSIGSTLADMGRLLVQVPAAIVSMSNVMFPEETRRHARSAAREGFLAVRSLLAAVGDGIEGMLAEPQEGGGKPQTTVSGPAGTWGTAKAGGASGNKTRRIEVSDAQASLPADDEEAPADRGLRADIDY